MDERLEHEKYPIYAYERKWLEDIDPEHPPHEAWTKDAPEGRFWNGTGGHQMFREEQSASTLAAMTLEWWNEYRKEGRNRSDLVSTFVLEVMARVICPYCGDEMYWVSDFSPYYRCGPCGATGPLWTKRIELLTRHGMAAKINRLAKLAGYTPGKKKADTD